MSEGSNAPRFQLELNLTTPISVYIFVEAELNMLRSYKYRIYPTEDQKVLLAKTFGCCRYVYNWALDLKEKAYEEEGKTLQQYEIQKRLTKELAHDRAPWLSEVSAKAIGLALVDLFDGYKNFFAGRANKPNHRIKRGRQHFHDRPNDRGYGVSVDFKKGLVSIPKIKNIPCVFHRRFNGKIRQVSVEFLTTGKYFVSILIEDGTLTPIPPEVDPQKALGIDTGLKTFATLSNGQSFETMHFLKENARRLKLMQRRFRRKKKDSRKFKIYKRRIARLHEHITNQRNDYIDKITHHIASENQATTICVENLNIKGMLKNKSFAYNLSDAGVGLFYNKLKYKCAWKGKNYVEIDRFAPSSKMCSHCGYIYRRLSIKEREWTCPECGTHHDRDLNAAINIKNLGLGLKLALPSVRRKVTPVEQPLVDDRSSEPKKPCRDSARADKTGKVKGDDTRHRV